MNQNRQVIVNNLKYLKKNWKDFMNQQYPNSSPSYRTYPNFVANVVRFYGVQRPVYSNYQDLESIYVSTIDKQTLINFLENLPDDAILQTKTCEDDYGHTDVYLDALVYTHETDEEYCHRLSKFVLSTEAYIKTKDFPIRRSDVEPELNKYIEYLESIAK